MKKDFVTFYEWVVESIEKYNEDDNLNDIYDSAFYDKLDEVRDMRQGYGRTFRLGMVRREYEYGDQVSVGWAYVDMTFPQWQLPDWFGDASNRKEARVPNRFKIEFARNVARLMQLPKA